MAGRSKARRTRIKRLQTAIFVVLVPGLFLASLHVNRRELPLIRIGEIKPFMSFFTVRVQGILESDACRLGSGSVLYMVDDGTGKLPVFLAPAPEEPLPKAGSRISVEGRLSMGAGTGLRMRARSVERMVVAAGDFVSESKLSDITAEQKGVRRTVYGRVSKIWHPHSGSKAPHKIVLADPSGSLEVIHWFDPERTVALGDVLEVRGMIDLYKNRLQLKVWAADDIRILERIK